MHRTPDFLTALDELDQTTDQTGAMLSLLMHHLAEAVQSDGECLSEETLLNYVWALNAQNERMARAIQVISNETAPAAA
ncbi:hypothetical protein C7H09_03895 [Marinobacter fuscus]|uniref:Uncharacterized protein n=1 Tax=Marinobacter fuscus TaxID=2109942 RepID=A0A2T1KQQ7_9GAMM|nr:hypothetical protein [Marinobacter fuscus]PSF12360.1 hypothetical protein C7H09_03895 [Marinobacter fuscus]